MLIVSKFHDYYDVGMKLGADKTCVYRRNTVVIDKKPSTETLRTEGWNTYVVGFCGKFYPMVYHVDCNGVINKIIWDADEAVRFIPQKRMRFYWDQDSIDSELGVRRFFDRKYPKLETLFQDHRTPIFGFDPPSLRMYSWKKDENYLTLVLNPNLKNLKFYKVKDPITAYQEIYMYLSGVLGSRGPEPLPISDKLKAQAHGHDGKYSFKKAPGEPKRRKKK